MKLSNKNIYRAPQEGRPIILAMDKLALLISICLFFSGCATAPYRPAIAPSGIYHIVGSGQTLYRISKTYNVGIKEIMRLNSIRDPNQIGVGEKLFIPRARIPLEVEPYKPQNLESIEKIVSKKYSRVKWKYITLHHSATAEGNAEAFDRNHRYRHMGGLFYHFVIGNGRGAEDGEIEVGWRWVRQNEVNRKGDIQICLVGDFNKQELSEAQLNSLAGLIKVLKAEYSIALYNIRRHKDVNGKPTECPGNKFSLARVMAEVQKSGLSAKR